MTTYNIVFRATFHFLGAWDGTVQFPRHGDSYYCCCCCCCCFYYLQPSHRWNIVTSWKVLLTSKLLYLYSSTPYVIGDNGEGYVEWKLGSLILKAWKLCSTFLHLATHIVIIPWLRTGDFADALSADCAFPSIMMMRDQPIVCRFLLHELICTVSSDIVWSNLIYDYHLWQLNPRMKNFQCVWPTKIISARDILIPNG